MPDLSFGKFAGLQNTRLPERLGLTDLAVADNVDISDTGEASLRAGSALEIAGATHSLWSNPSHTVALCVQGTSLLWINPDYSTTAIGTGLTAGRTMSFLEVASRIYLTNGVDKGVLDAGVVRTWGLNQPPHQPSAVAIAGRLPAGTYQYAITRLRGDGQESGTGLAERIDLPADSGIRFTFNSPSDPGVAQQAIYLSTQDGETLMRALTVPVGTTTADYLGDAHELSTPLRTQFLSDPPAGQILAHYRGRIHIAVNDLLYVTNALGYEHCDLRDFLPIDGSRIRVVAPVENGILVGTDKAVRYHPGDSLKAMGSLPRLEAASVEGSLVYTDGAYVGDGSLSGERIPIWTTSLGVVYGTPSGQLVNLTQERYRFPVGQVGAAYFRNDTGYTQYKVFLQS